MAPDDRLAGRLLAAPIVAADGRVLCRAGAELTARVLQKLRERGVDVVYVDDPGFGGIDARESVGEASKSAMRTLMAGSVAAAAAGRMAGALDGQQIDGVAGDVIEAASGDTAPCLLWPRLRSTGPGQVDWSEPGSDSAALAVHALNTALIVAAAGPALSLGGAKVAHLVRAALVMDAGMAILPPDVWSTAGELSTEERGRLRLHPQAALDAFRDSGTWDTFQRIAVLQHHERLNGSGYPQGLEGEKLHRSVLLVAAADMYAALCEPRPYRAAWRPEDTVEMLMATAGLEFPVDVVRAVVSAVGLYPRGALVRLSDGRTAAVAQSGQGTFLRPTLRVGEEEVDLNEHLTLTVEGIVTD